MKEKMAREAINRGTAIIRGNTVVIILARFFSSPKLDYKQSLRIITRARKSSEACEKAKNKKPRGSWGGGASLQFPSLSLRLTEDDCSQSTPKPPYDTN